MNLFPTPFSKRLLVSLLLTPFSLCLANMKVGDVKTIISIPTLDYAVVDLSASLTDENIDNIAFDDDNKVAFTWWEENTHKVAKWVNGIIEAGSPQSTGCTLTRGSDTFSVNEASFLINTNGDLCSCSATSRGMIFGYWAYGNVGATDQYDKIDLLGGDTSGAGYLLPDGSFLFAGDPLGNPNSLIKFTSGVGSTILYSLNDDIGTDSTYANVSPYCYSSSGFTGVENFGTKTWTTGTEATHDLQIFYRNNLVSSVIAIDHSKTQLDSAETSTAAAPPPFDPMVAINDQKDVLYLGTFNTATYLFENPYVRLGASQVKTYFLKHGTDTSMVPSFYQAQLRNITPFLMSNRVVSTQGGIPVPTDTPELHIAFTAETLRDAEADRWEYATFLLRKFSTNKWDLHEIAGNGVYNLKYLNKYGNFSALGNPDFLDTTDHALLLLSVEIDCTSAPYASGQTWKGPANNLLSVWPEASFGLAVKLNINWPEANLPPNSILWNVIGQDSISNKENISLTWSINGIRNIQVTVFGITKNVFVDIPDVGTTSLDEILASDPLLYSLGVAYGVEAKAHAESAGYGDSDLSDQIANAIRHSYWNALMSSDITIGSAKSLMFSTAYEHDHKGAAYDSTMDLHNNYIGTLIIKRDEETGDPDRAAITAALNTKIWSGDLWFTENASYVPIAHIIKTNGKKIFPY